MITIEIYDSSADESKSLKLVEWKWIIFQMVTLNSKINDLSVIVKYCSGKFGI